MCFFFKKLFMLECENQKPTKKGSKMPSDVFFVDLRARNNYQNKVSKIRKMMELEPFKNIVRTGDLTAIKIHFGEAGNDSYINPVFVRQVVECLKKVGAKPFVTDTNTLYSGTRHNAADHLETATSHGFVPSVIDAPVIIADGIKGNNYRNMEIRKKHFETVKIAGDIVDADSMVVMSHFKGHEMAGFGGAIKNLAMGCASPLGKRDQHSTKQYVMQETCVGCGRCCTICPQEAITICSKARIDSTKCIGCGECMTVCPVKAISLDWSTEIDEFMERMTEYAYGAVVNKQQRVIYLNFLTNIVPDCDCAGWSDYPIVPDIGFLASLDPVAIDKASYDLVNQQQGNPNSLLQSHYEPGEDKFKGIRENTNGYHQLSYGEKIGLGIMEYQLIQLAI